MMNLLIFSIIISAWGSILLLILGALAHIFGSYRTRVLQNQILELNIAAMSWPKQQELPNNIKKLIQNSANHPEAQEIQPQDELMGILFDGGMYPPELGEEYDDAN
jgi:hypothetical protein